jgi:hypothetical protein
MPQKYRKKPVVIEAIQWDGGNHFEILRWMGGRYISTGVKGDHLHIPTLEGDMNASVGDYIIKGIQGEFYPCKPDIFLATYRGGRVNLPYERMTPGLVSPGGLVVPATHGGHEQTQATGPQGSRSGCVRCRVRPDGCRHSGGRSSGTVFGLGSLVHTAFSKTCSTMAVGPASLGDPVKDCGAAPAETSTEPPAGG